MLLLLLLRLLNCKCRMAAVFAGPQPQVSDGSIPRRTSTASVGWQPSTADLNRKCRMAVFRRTSTASSGWQCSPPDLNRKLPLAVFLPDLNLEFRMAVLSPDLSRKLRLAAFPRPQPRASAGSVSCRTSTASQKIRQIERQKDCQKIRR